MQHLSEIVEEARKKGKKRLAVAYGQDAHTLAAVYAAYKEGLVEPILFGDPKIIEQVCKEENIDCNIFKIIPESNDVKCVNLAVNAVVTGEADVLMKGLVSTDKYMRGILNKDAGLFPPKGTLSHVAVVEMPNYPKLLVISDVAVIPQPDFKQKTILIGYLTRIANLIGIKTPKIACIAPSEQLLPSVLSSTEAALLAKMGDRGQLGNVVIDGPLSLDVALYKEAAEIKKVKGFRRRRCGLPALPQHRIGQRLLQGFHAHGRRRDRSDGHGNQSSLRADFARRLQPHQTLLDRTGLSGR